MSDSFENLWTVAAMLICPWDSAGKNTEVACHALFQGIFLTQGSNPYLLHWQVDSLTLSHRGYPYGLVCTKLLSHAQISVTPWTLACQASVCRILQARILEWVAFPFCRGSSQPRDRTQVSCIVGRFSYHLNHQGSLWTGRNLLFLFRFLFILLSFFFSSLTVKNVLRS